MRVRSTAENNRTVIDEVEEGVVKVCMYPVAVNVERSSCNVRLLLVRFREQRWG